MFYIMHTNIEIVAHVLVRYVETSYNFVYVLVRNIEISYYIALGTLISISDKSYSFTPH